MSVIPNAVEEPAVSGKGQMLVLIFLASIFAVDGPAVRLEHRAHDWCNQFRHRVSLDRAGEDARSHVVAGLHMVIYE